MVRKGGQVVLVRISWGGEGQVVVRRGGEGTSSGMESGKVVGVAIRKGWVGQLVVWRNGSMSSS